MDVYLTKTARCSYKTGQLAKFPDGSGFWPYPVATTNTMPTTQYDTVIAFNVITHVQNGYEWLEGLYRTIKPGGLLMFSDYYFDGTDENFWYAPVRLSARPQEHKWPCCCCCYRRLIVPHPMASLRFRWPPPQPDKPVRHAVVLTSRSPIQFAGCVLPPCPAVRSCVPPLFHVVRCHLREIDPHSARQENGTHVSSNRTATALKICTARTASVAF
jgi:hypothetical protein